VTVGAFDKSVDSHQNKDLVEIQEAPLKPRAVLESKEHTVSLL